MGKKTFLMLICFVAIIISISTLHGQGSKKTITLPNGEVICDLNGDWDALYDHPRLGKSTDILKITQRGGSFEGVKTIGGPYVPKDAVSIKGELSKDGITKVQVVMRIFYSGDPGKMTETPHLLDCKGQISEDGNKIIIDGGETIRVTLTRK
jgi:hypothetical protein